MRRVLLPIVILLLISSSSPLEAAWIEDGIALYQVEEQQTDEAMIPDGEGGVFIVWEDHRGIDVTIYAQRLDAYGNELWTPGGIIVCTSNDTQNEPAITSDGSGGCIITWNEWGSSSWDIFAQRIDGDGTLLWSGLGVIVCEAASTQNSPEITENGSGGAIIAWEDYRTGGTTNYDIYAQMVDENGLPQWTPDGVALCTNPAQQSYIDIVPDGLGGAVVCWTDYGGDTNIYAQRVNADGTTEWMEYGYPIVNTTGAQLYQEMIANENGTVTVVWADDRGTDWDIYASKISMETGGPLWGTYGRSVCTAVDDQTYPVITTDGANGAIIAWIDDRNDAAGDIYAIKLDPEGSPEWLNNGLMICEAYSTQSNPRIVSDEDGGAIIGWTDWRNVGYRDLYAQRVDSKGLKLWSGGGELVCGAQFNQQLYAVVSDGAGGAFFAWEDYRDYFSTQNVWVQRIERNGYWGYPAPAIAGARDVPGDQGGYVNLAWDASRLDLWPDELIDHYTLWRAIDEEAAALMVKSGIPVIQRASDIGLITDSPVIRMELLAGEPYYWHMIQTVSASEFTDYYSEIVSTLFDSTDVSNEYHYFQVIAHGSDADAFWISAVDSGYSVDNIAPCPPAAVMAEQIFTPEGLEITWEPNTEIDFDIYVIHRGTDAGFEPDDGNLIYSACDTLHFDSDWSWDSSYWYKVAAVDVHGNVSEYVLLGPDEVTGEETSETPHATFLEQNYPNPFNPVTRIRFGLKETGRVSLRIYDTAGRLVRILVNERRDAGHYTEEWDGRDKSGRAVASGVYFYKLTAGVFEETKKMVLLR